MTGPSRRVAAGLVAGGLLSAGFASEPAAAAGVHRTPEARFAGIVDFPYEPHYAIVEAGPGPGEASRVRIAYYVAGPARGPTVVLMHGNPEWSYIYRAMAAGLAAEGFRVVMPNLPGFGRSDKPLAREWYSYGRLVRVMDGWLRAARIGPAAMFCQDWGGLIGLRLVDLNPRRFTRVVTANTALPFGQAATSAALKGWIAASQSIPRASLVLAAGAGGALSPAALAAYDAPFDTPESLIAMRALPELIPLTADSPEARENAAAFERLKRDPRPWLCLFSDGDPITREFYDLFKDNVAGARGRPHALLPGGHFVQEVQSPELVRRTAAFLRAA